MATGKCVNIGKPCSKALKRYVIEADKTNFVCPECGGKLVACDGPVTDPDSLKKGGGISNGGNSQSDKDKDKKKKLMYVIGAAAVIAIAGGATYFLSAGSDTPITKLEIADYDPMVWVDTTDTLTVVPTPADAKATYIWSSSNEAVATVMDGVVKVVGEGETTITVKVKGNEKISATAKLYSEIYEEYEGPTVEEPEDKGKDEGTTKPVQKPVSNKIDLGFATYEGDLKNGKPEGNGTMTFKTRHVIPGSKGDVVAEPREYAVGTWRNGEVNLVTLHQNNGNKPIITHK